MNRNENLGLYLGIIGIILSTLTIFLSYILVISIYDPWTQTISELGTTEGSKIPFTVGLSISSLFIFLFYFLFFKNYSIIPEIKYSRFLGLFASLNLFFVAIFPTEGSTEIIHQIVASLFFICTSLAIILLSKRIYFLKNKNSTLLAYLGFLIFIITLIYPLIRTGFNEIGPFTQKLIVLLFNIWFLLFLVKKDYFLKENS